MTAQDGNEDDRRTVVQHWCGLEGGAISIKLTVHIDPLSIHSYRVNLNDPSNVGVFLGSVNDYLSKVENRVVYPRSWSTYHAVTAERFR